MRYSKSDPAYRAGYRAAKKEALTKVHAAVASIEQDLNTSSGLSVMVWIDREKKEALLEAWRGFVRRELETI